MESLTIQDERKNTLHQFLGHQCGFTNYELQTIAPSASFRRYFRVLTDAGSFIAMDANPRYENCHSYIAIAKGLRELGLETPEIFFANLSQGFLLISDFGDATYLKVLNLQNADNLYRKGLQSLALLQTCDQVPGQNIPNFNSSWMWKEWRWYQEWFLKKFLLLDEQNSALDNAYATIVESASSQPYVFMHRDYHSANLMLLPNQNVGILDFQDAFIGPITYDLVSLLRDCYIEWPNELVHDWALQYWEVISSRMNVSKTAFLRWFDLMGLQRHLKALMTFSRKHIRDHNSNYLQYIPRTLHYLQTVSKQYNECKALHTHLTEKVMPRFEDVVSTCEG